LLEPWREQLAGMDDPWPAGPCEVPADPLDLPPPPPPTIVAGLLAGSARHLCDDDTMPLALVPFQRVEEPVVHSLETPPHGLRKFDLGTVPASVTPPRTWRKAAWFAVGTSAAVVCALVVAAVRLVGTPWSGTTIDALPAYPSLPMEIERLPEHETTDAPATSSSTRPDAIEERSGPVAPTDRADDVRVARGSTHPEMPWSSTTVVDDVGSPPSVPTETPSPPRTTVGPIPLTPTAPEEMGDRTEEYFALVTVDPVAAHELCTGGLAKEGPEGVVARYEGVERVEVQEIVIDRNLAVTTSTVRLVYEDGTTVVEERQLTFTWGGDPKISDEAIMG
jgi:hypothetical protein